MSQTILVTGASGFIATHIVDAFLAAGYSVRGAVRSHETADKVRSTFPEHVSNGTLTFAIVPDIAAEHAFDEAVLGVVGVIHTASPFTIFVADNERDLLKPAVEGTRNLLSSIKTHAPDVRRVVLTSSFASIIDVSKGLRPGYVYTEEDWNPISYAVGAHPSTPGMMAYIAAKTLAERAAWDFVAAEQTSWDLATICPPVVFGPNKNATADLKRLNTSSAQIYQLMTPSSTPSDPMPRSNIPAWADVRDVAQAHLRAYEIAEAGGERFLVTTGKYCMQQIADILREKVPEVKERVPLGEPGSVLPASMVYDLDGSKAERILGVKYRSLEESVVDAAVALLELEKRLH